MIVEDPPLADSSTTCFVSRTDSQDVQATVSVNQAIDSTSEVDIATSNSTEHVVEDKIRTNSFTAEVSPIVSNNVFANKGNSDPSNLEIVDSSIILATEGNSTEDTVIVANNISSNTDNSIVNVETNIALVTADNSTQDIGIVTNLIASDTDNSIRNNPEIIQEVTAENSPKQDTVVANSSPSDVCNIIASNVEVLPAEAVPDNWVEESENEDSREFTRNGTVIFELGSTELEDDSPAEQRLLQEPSSRNQRKVVIQLPHRRQSQPAQGLTQDEDEDDTRCGLGPFKPSWLQRLASKKTYVVLHGLIGMNMFALGSYFVGTISTIEKRFKIPSRTSGLISSAWDIGSVFSLLALSYLGRGHKTRYVAVGTVMVGLSCYLRLVPHVMFGAGQDAIELTVEYGDKMADQANSSQGPADGVSLCGKPAPNDEDCSEGGSVSVPSIVLFLAHAFMGIGGSMYYTLGMAYLDDNTRKNKAPIFLAITQCIRMLGPTFGFVMASYALEQYVDPSLHPTIDSEDPRWIGAWWLGWVPFGTISCSLAGIMLLFPKQLPRTAQRHAEQARPKIQRQKSFKDFRATFCRMLKNKVLLFNTFSGVCFMFGYIGYWTFMPKYMETQYRQSAARASLISGSVGLIFTAAGIMTSALVISKFKPRPRYLAAWNVIVEIVDVLGHFSWAFLSCPAEDLHGSWREDKSWDLIADCNNGCDCGPTVKYSPICSLDGSTTFYSACHAGCNSSDLINGTRTYSNCSCISSQTAVDGPCAMDCATNFTIFLITQCTMRFLGSSGKAGNTLIQFRCVDEEDKPLSIAFSEFLLCGLAFIPGPIVYGMLLDSACLVWGQTCGQSGNCWLYDGQTLRFLLNFTAAGCLMCGMLLDVGVWYYAAGLQIYDEEDEEREGTKKKSAVLDNLLENL